MTRHEEMLAATICSELGQTVPNQTLRRMFELGLMDIRGCERLAARAEIERLGREGVPRCEAMHAVAAAFCCSYEKVRGIYYNTFKS